MPIYEYRCKKGHNFEVTQSMSDDPVTACTECGAPVERVFHPVAVHFKGSGFYTTDYGRGRTGGSGDSASSSDSSKKESKESKDSKDTSSDKSDSSSKSDTPSKSESSSKSEGSSEGSSKASSSSGSGS